jgi:anti-sigma B factor antagonist
MLINIIDSCNYKIVDVKERRLDASIANDFKNTVIDTIAKTNNIILDFSNVDFIDSSILSALVYLYKLCQKENKKLFLVNLSKKLLNIFHITGLTSIFKIFNNINECIDQVNSI